LSKRSSPPSNNRAPADALHDGKGRFDALTNAEANRNGLIVRKAIRWRHAQPIAGPFDGAGKIQARGEHY
jgi:hypothetical protein